jgi:outer membrane protein assembly factor BamB
LICFGSENGSLHCYDIIKKERIWEMKIGDIRVKCLIKVDNWLVTALSDGHVTVWKLNDSKKPVESCSLFLDCRITCIACNNSFM